MVIHMTDEQARLCQRLQAEASRLNADEALQNDAHAMHEAKALMNTGIGMGLDERCWFSLQIFVNLYEEKHGPIELPD